VVVVVNFKRGTDGIHLRGLKLKEVGGEKCEGRRISEMLYLLGRDATAEKGVKKPRMTKKSDNSCATGSLPRDHRMYRDEKGGHIGAKTKASFSRPEGRRPQAVPGFERGEKKIVSGALGKKKEKVRSPTIA